MKPLTGKQRSYLRSLANTMEVIVQIGKDPIGDTLIKQVSDALEARELIKLTVLRNSPYTAKEACEILADCVQAHPVQVIGNRFVLYRPSAEEPRIELP